MPCATARSAATCGCRWRRSQAARRDRDVVAGPVTVSLPTLQSEMPSSARPEAAAPHRTSILSNGLVSVIDYRCAAGPGNPPFAEQHARHSVSYVRKGSFGCHCRGRVFDLVPGSILVGYPGDEYMCTHDHHLGGDECLSFQLEPDLVDDIGDDAVAWRCGALPPVPALVVLGELAQAAAQGRADIGLDELGVLIATQVVHLASGREVLPSGASAQDRRRAVRAALWIEARSRDRIDLDSAAAEAGVSRSTSCGCSPGCSG